MEEGLKKDHGANGKDLRKLSDKPRFLVSLHRIEHAVSTQEEYYNVLSATERHEKNVCINRIGDCFVPAGRVSNPLLLDYYKTPHTDYRHAFHERYDKTAKKSLRTQGDVAFSLQTGYKKNHVAFLRGLSDSSEICASTDVKLIGYAHASGRQGVSFQWGSCSGKTRSPGYFDRTKTKKGRLLYRFGCAPHGGTVSLDRLLAAMFDRSGSSLASPDIGDMLTAA